MSRLARSRAALVCAIAFASAARFVFADEPAADPSYVFAPGPFAPAYAPPEPGSYALPVVRRVGDHPIVEAGGRKTTLFELAGSGPSVVAFVYLSCTEARGCPLSMAVLHRLDQAIATDPTLAAKVSLLTISFDPGRDTPSRLADMRSLHQPRANWRFATAESDAALAPLLTDFDQRIDRLHYPDGRDSGLFRHVLKVFLLDAEHRVRNVYSVGFLNAELVLADLKTLMLRSAP